MTTLTVALLQVEAAGYDQAENLAPGDSFPVASLDTAAGPVQVGAMICYDRESPETARILALGGAEVILVPNACPMEGGTSQYTLVVRAGAGEGSPLPASTWTSCAPGAPARSGARPAGVLSCTAVSSRTTRGRRR